MEPEDARGAIRVPIANECRHPVRALRLVNERFSDRQTTGANGRPFVIHARLLAGVDRSHARRGSAGVNWPKILRRTLRFA